MAVPENEALKFSEPQPVYQTFAELPADEGGARFKLKVTGPLELLKGYIEERPLCLKVVPREAALEMPGPAGLGNGDPADSSYAEKGEYYGKEKEVLAEDLPEDPASTLHVEIRVEEMERPYVLSMEIDPHIGQGQDHFYYLYRAASAWANCFTSVGDADLYLAERRANGSWQQRDLSEEAGTSADSVSANRQLTGDWRLRVHGYLDSQYTLSGRFVVI